MSVDAPWVLEWIPASFSSNHSQRRSDYRLSKAQQEQEMDKAGQDGYWLLAQVAQHGSSRLKTLPEIALLEQVLAAQFDPPGSDHLTVKARVEGSACGDSIVSPHDPEARYSRKNASTELEISPYHAELSQRRQLQRDPDYQQDLHARARIGSTLSDLIRRHGLSHCRYRGKCRITLQMVLTAIALNLKCLARYLNPDPVPVSL